MISEYFTHEQAHRRFLHTFTKSARVKTNGVGYAKFRSRSHNAVIRVYDEAGNVIEMQGTLSFSSHHIGISG
jgi:hypothetical protein